MSDAAALPDPAGEPAAAVLTAFANGLTDWGDDEELELRLRARTLALFEQRELASDALGAVLVLIDWMRQDVLPLVSVDLAGLPKVADLQAVKALNTALAGCERIARDRWRADGSVDEAWRVYELLRSLRRAVMKVERMPRYRMPDPSWKAKQPRPTPMGLCAEAAAEIAGAFVSTVAEWPDAERALDRLGLGGDDNARLLAERARRGLDALRVDGGVKLLALAERVVIARDAAEQRGPEEVASQALRDFEHEPVATIAESAYLRTRSLASAAPTIQDAALALLRELCSELAAALGRDVRERELVTRPPSSATPVEAPPPRATPDDLARRIVTSLERGKRDPRAALVAMHELGAKLDERQQRLVAEAVLDHLAGARAGRSSLSERLARARFRIGAVDGPLLLPLGDRSRVHLWRSDGTDDLATVATLCGSPIRAGGSWKRIFDMPQRRDDDDDVFGFGRSRSACPSCLAAAREDGPYPAPVSRSEWPGEHYEVAIATVLALEVGGRGWGWDDPVDDVVRDSVRDMVVADATRLGVVCAQRTLGPVRYLKEQEALSAPLGGQLTADDWATIVGAVDVRLAKELVRCAHAREVPSRAVLRLVTPAPPSDDGHS